MHPKVLIVDDEPHIRLLLERALEDLEDEGIEILLADNGKDALELIQAEKPALVFLDVMMPNMNGFDVCHTVKKELRLANVHIVMLTAKGQEFDKQRGEEVGANIYMTKPFDPDEIRDKAEEVLGLSGG
jgi:two-component system alkaline phosphatase synthesis response regulator PhoP